MNAKKANKALRKIVMELGFEEVRPVQHGTLYRHPTLTDHTADDNRLVSVSFGGTPSDSNFFRVVVRELNNKLGLRGTESEIPHLNG